MWELKKGWMDKGLAQDWMLSGCKATWYVEVAIVACAEQLQRPPH